MNVWILCIEDKTFMKILNFRDLICKLCSDKYILQEMSFSLIVKPLIIIKMIIKNGKKSFLILYAYSSKTEK